jgi:hypothetical protein
MLVNLQKPNQYSSKDKGEKVLLWHSNQLILMIDINKQLIYYNILVFEYKF